MISLHFRACCQEIWQNMWKDTAVGHYMRKCPLCQNCCPQQIEQSPPVTGTINVFGCSNILIGSILIAAVTFFDGMLKQSGEIMCSRSYFL